MPLAWLLTCFQSLPPLPTNKLGPSGSDSRVGVYILGPSGSLQQTLLWGWEFLLTPQPPHVFSVRGFEALFSCVRNLGCTVCLAPQLFLLAYLHVNMGPHNPPGAALPWVLFSLPAPLCPSYWSGWIFFFNSLVVGLPYSLIFWHSGYFLFLNLFLSFWLYGEAKCIYLQLHLGPKSVIV